MADLVAWSPITNGKNTGTEDDPKMETTTIEPGESVTQAALGLDDDGWQQLLDSRAVRKMDYPDMPETFQGSPVEFMRHQASLAASDALAEVETSEENISAIAAANAASTGVELPEAEEEAPTATPAAAKASSTNG
jgi:hypothetical protein